MKICSFFLLSFCMVLATASLTAADDIAGEKGSTAPSLPFKNTVRLVMPLTPEVIQAYPACEVSPDKPDSIAVAFRDDKDLVQLISSNYHNRRFVGAELGDVKIQCPIVFESNADPDYANHDYHGWIHSVYTEDGKTIYALVHNEYWGHEVYPDACEKDYKKCWANSVTWVYSTDGGATYQLPPPDERVVAAVGEKYRVALGKPYGFINPTNIIRDGDFLYSIIHSWNSAGQTGGSYLIRKHIDAPWFMWDIWNGEKHGFKNIRELMQKGKTVGRPLPIGSPELPVNIYSISRHEPSGLFVGLLPSTHRSRKFPENDGYYITTSPDLIHWSSPTQIVQANYMSRFLKDLYPQTYFHLGSLIDPSSTARLFDTIGNQPYLYTTRITSRKPGTPALIELVRIPLDLTHILPQSGNH